MNVLPRASLLRQATTRIHIPVLAVPIEPLQNDRVKIRTEANDDPVTGTGTGTQSIGVLIVMVAWQASAVPRLPKGVQLGI